VIALRHTGRRILALEAEANDLETEIERLVQRTVPELLAETGVGPISAAQLYCCWSHATHTSAHEAAAARNASASALSHRSQAALTGNVRSAASAAVSRRFRR
jgi:hypothetical protein